MAWEWVLPTASATSALIVGVSGIIAGSLTAKRQQNLQLRLHEQSLIHEKEKELRVIRREVYARYLSMVYEYLEDKDGSTFGFLRAFQEVAIVAGPGVLHHAHSVNTVAGSLRETESPVPKEALERIAQALGDLIHAMSDELAFTGEEGTEAFPADRVSEGRLQRALNRRNTSTQ